MNSHELARLLLTMPDLPIATHANDHVFTSGNNKGALKIGLLKHYAGEHVIVGDISRTNLNRPNWYITKMLHGMAAKRWPYKDSSGHWVFPPTDLTENDP